MDFVYICRTGSNEELRYSIRSVVNSFPNSRVWVVGGIPEWYCGDHIPVNQDKNTYTNVLNNLMAIADSLDISSKFVLMNDDFFIINKINKIEYFYNGLLLDKINRYKDLVGESGYITRLIKTYNRLKKLNVNSPIDYELHIPFVMEKDNLRLILNKDGKFLYRSMYGNRFNVKGTQIEDVKVYVSGGLVKKSFDYLNNDSDFLSTTEDSFDLVEPILKERFPNKSNYEK
jgi:hypothetical protein